MIFPVLIGGFIAGTLQLNPGEVPVVGELAQLAATEPIGQPPCRLAANHRGIPAKDVMQLKRVAEALVGVPGVIARQDLLGYAEGFKTTSKLPVSAHKLIHLLQYVTPTQSWQVAWT